MKVMFLTGCTEPTFVTHDASTPNVTSSMDPAPLDKSMRKESYVTDTDRSFPLAGGVVHKRTQPVSNFSNNTPKDTHDRELGTKEKAVHDGHGREGLAGAAAAAAAATTGVAASRTLSRSQERDVKDQALETRRATYGDIPAAQAETVQPTTISAAPTSTSSSKHNPEALAAATAAATAAAKSSHNSGFSPSERLGQNTTTTTAAPVLSRGLGDFGGARPHTHRTASRPHIPGEFPSPTPGDETKTFLDYRPVMDATGDSTVAGTVADTPTAHPELRHTGTLEQPAAKEVESSSGHHYGRDAAIAGGVGAAGLGAYAATRRPETENKPLYEEESPYSSKSLDPRVSGAGAATTSIDQQRFDPQAKTEPSPHAQTLEPAGIAAASDPRTLEPVQKDEPDHHYGRDAALVGAGAATAAGATYALSNRDEPESRDFANTQAAPAAPAAQATPVTQATPVMASEKRRESGPNTFYGTTGAPGPIADKSSSQKPVDGVQQTPAPVTSSVPERIPEENSEHKSEHHYGRDAALVGGAGAAGLTAHEVAQRYDEHRITQPGAAMDDQRYDPSAPGAHAANPVPTKAQYNYNDPNTTSNVNRSTIAPAAGAGLAAGAAGGAAYAGMKGSENSRDMPAHDPLTAQAPSTQGHQRYDSVNGPTQKEDHTKRNAALAGTAGAATLGGAAYAYNEHSNREQERLAQQSEKEHARLEKRAEKEQHVHEKEAHKHDKAAAKEERRRSKDSEEREDKEKKGGLLGFLHRDKTRKEKKTGQSSNESSPRQSREVTPAAAAGLPAAHSSDEHMPQDMEASHASQGSSANSPRWKASHKLHKDPPKNHPARQAWEEQQAGLVGAPQQYQHDPVMGGKTVEPHTGLPIDMSKGDGAGGIDGNPAVQGVHGDFEGREHQIDWEGVRKNDTVY